MALPSTKIFESLLILILLHSSLQLVAQHHYSEENDQKCATVERDKKLREVDPSYRIKRKSINKNIQEYIKNSYSRELNGEIIVIPVVFHCIHNNSPIGSAANMDEYYLYAQLQQLNDDFRKLNVDSENIWSQAADAEIEFCLASEDPNGNITNGITRHNIPHGNWPYWDFDTQVKPITIWDRDNYLNIWIADLRFLLGYSQFPGGPAETDGIALDFKTVGSLDIQNPTGHQNGYGRIGTHEVGHWLDIFHIWGDDMSACTGSDMCDDTPDQAGESDDCPTGELTDACSPNSPGIMYQNFMDYTDDQCSNLFTEDQKARMHATLNGARSSLITASCGGTPPQVSIVPNYDQYEFCETKSISFYDFSSGNPDSWNWTFSGGGVSPTSSMDQHPTIMVNSSGTLSVTLSVSNANGTTNTTQIIELTSHPAGSDYCISPPCLNYQSYPEIRILYSDPCFIGECYDRTPYSDTWKVREGKGYFLGQLDEGIEYTFEFCEGYDPNIFEAVITIGKWDFGNNALVPNYVNDFTFDCSITFVADELAEYVAVVTEYLECGGVAGAQDNGEMSISCTTPCASVCGKQFYDSGGPLNSYDRLEDKTYVLCPDNPATEIIIVDFIKFSIYEQSFGTEYMRVFDGIDTLAPLIDTYTNSNPPSFVGADNPTGCLTFHFESLNIGPWAGWLADIICSAPCPEDYAGVNALTGPESGSGGQYNDGDYETNGPIESTQILQSGSIDYDSGESILLDIGFEVKTNTVFDAFINGCNQGGGGNTLTEGEKQHAARQ